MEQLTAPSGPTFAGLRLAEPVERIAGGYETDVFRSGDRRLALKLKHSSGSPAAMLARARRLRQVADMFRSYIAPEHGLPNDYLIVAGADGASHVLAVQPFLDGAHTLDTLQIDACTPAERSALAGQLAAIVAGALDCYRGTGYLPDLYGLGHRDGAQARTWDLRWVLRVGWRMLAGRPLISAHNLMLTADGQIVLVDYDPICRGWLFCRLAYLARALLLLRDRAHIAALSGDATGGRRSPAPGP